MNVGFELADARRRMGLTLEEISRRTKISVERLSAIERGDRDNLPALVYLNGFLRAYAAEVNLDGQDVTHRYLEELERTAQFAGARKAAVIDEGSPVLELPIAEQSLEYFVSEDRFHVQPALNGLPHRSGRERGAWREAELANEMASQRKSVPSPVFPESKLLLRDAAELNDSEDVVEPLAHAAIVPSAPSRRRHRPMLILLVAAATAAGFLLSANLDRLAQEPDDSAESRPATESDAARTSGPGDSVAKPESPAGGQPPASDTNSNSAHASVSKPDRDGADSVVAAAERALQSERVAEPDNLSGWWTFSNRVESTSFAAFDNLNLGYQVHLQQRGDHITGTGHKWMENGKPLPANRRTPIVFEGTRTGERLELTFTEKGSRRVSQGTFVMELTPDGVLQGRFVSDAANSQGSSLARRTTPPTH